MTTPTQLAKWREDATKAWVSDGLIDVGQPAHTAYIEAAYAERLKAEKELHRDFSRVI